MDRREQYNDELHALTRWDDPALKHNEQGLPEYTTDFLLTKVPNCVKVGEIYYNFHIYYDPASGSWATVYGGSNTRVLRTMSSKSPLESLLRFAVKMYQSATSPDAANHRFFKEALKLEDGSQDT
jgi:hypothetical protein